MNYGISILFRAIPLAMALFCFGYGAFIYGYGDAGNRVVAGPVVFSLGMICIALFCTHLTYGKANIVLISLLQLGVYAALSINRLKKEYVIANICIFIVLNFIYVKISKKRENIKG